MEYVTKTELTQILGISISALSKEYWKEKLKTVDTIKEGKTIKYNKEQVLNLYKSKIWNKEAVTILKVIYSEFKNKKINIVKELANVLHTSYQTVYTVFTKGRTTTFAYKMVEYIYNNYKNILSKNIIEQIEELIKQYKDKHYKEKTFFHVDNLGVTKELPFTLIDQIINTNILLKIPFCVTYTKSGKIKIEEIH